MFRRMMPRSVSGQIALIVVMSIALVVLVGRAGRTIRHSHFLGLGDIDTFVQQVTTIASLIRDAPGNQREKVISWSKATGMDLSIVASDQAARMEAESMPESWTIFLIRTFFPFDQRLPPGSRLVYARNEISLLVPIDAGSTLVAHDVPNSIFTDDIVGPLSYYILAFAILLILFGTYSRWAFLRPLTRISAEVKRADAMEDRRFVIEHGPPEVVALTRALDHMRTRVRHLLDTRARMLRGVSHDLRTPLTRLRQRVERLHGSELQQAMLSDIARIDTLVEETLDYLRADAAGEERERIDVASLLQTIQAEFADLGSDVRYQGPDHLAAMVKPNALHRALTNLCNNSIKFGNRAIIGLSAADATLSIEVADDGPGIPSDLRQRAIEPFFSADRENLPASREAGFGLGLSIVSEIVAAHGGVLALLDNHPSGLVARIELPLQ